MMLGLGGGSGNGEKKDRKSDPPENLQWVPGRDPLAHGWMAVSGSRLGSGSLKHSGGMSAQA